MSKPKYRKWLEEVAAIKDWTPQDMDNDITYDYELFYNRDPIEAKRILKKKKDAHFTDIGKTIWHPTFSDESYYSGRRSIKNPKGLIGGHWSNNGTRYTLSKDQIDNNWDIKNTIDYVTDAEPKGLEIRMPNGTMPIINGERLQKILPTIEIVKRRKRR